MSIFGYFDFISFEKLSTLSNLDKSNWTKIAFFLEFSGNSFIFSSTFFLFLQANITLAFELSRSFAVSYPIPSEAPVIIISFPVKSFFSYLKDH